VNPPLSVVVPALNEQACIASTLEPLQALRAAGHQLVVVDGGSTDATTARARPLADRVIESPPGRARQMNRGAAVCDGTILWFLHADTRVPPAAGDAILAALVDPGRCWGRFDIRLSGTAPVLRLVAALMNLRSRLSGIATGDQGIFVRREVFEAVGGYPDIPLMEDIALSRRLRSLARPACIGPPLVTSSRRWERDGIARTILLMWRLRLAYALGTDPRVLARAYR